MSVAGYNTKIKLSGSGTTMSSEAMAATTGTNEYQISNSAKGIFDPTTTPSFTVGGTAISSTDISSIDYLFGKVTFSSTKGAAIKVSGTYLPTTNIAGAHAYNLNISRNLLDDTDFNSSGWISRANGLKDVSFTVNRWDDVSTQFLDLINSTKDVIADVRPGNSTSVVYRGVFKVESEAKSGDVTALEGSDVSFQLNGSSNASFGIGSI